MSQLNVMYMYICLNKSMDVTLEYMQLIFALLEHVSTSVLNSIESVELGPDFAIAWIITWFAHVLPNMDDVRRLFDLFLATDPIMLVYVSVAVSLYYFFKKIGYRSRFHYFCNVIGY
ncbi:unnamed protein product [Schistosoma curassoni]|uniref:Rab-GAP TBC domain-containing protein n=1 Tax=Schistosoma curassoni TaxID=6186 RepID=A0A183JKJ3_9TREM|nr:unnamed protein product [Schistosoma curassoni]